MFNTIILCSCSKTLHGCQSLSDLKTLLLSFISGKLLHRLATFCAKVNRIFPRVIYYFFFHDISKLIVLKINVKDCKLKLP